MYKIRESQVTVLILHILLQKMFEICKILMLFICFSLQECLNHIMLIHGKSKKVSLRLNETHKRNFVSARGCF